MTTRTLGFALLLILVLAPSALGAQERGSWRRLPVAPISPDWNYRTSVWTGKEMLVWGQGTRESFNPVTNTWRRLPGSRLLSIHDGFGAVVWTGRELIGWGGGCCGDAFSDGAAYNPTTNSWRKLSRSPLAPSQGPLGAWTGRELIILVGDTNPDGKPWPAQLARAAAYNPVTDTWRRIAKLPAPRGGSTAVWDGRELLVIGGAPAPRGGNPAPLTKVGFAYDPKLDRWSRLPAAPLRGRLDPTAVWTGRTLIVWGGTTGRPPYRGFADGAVLTP